MKRIFYISLFLLLNITGTTFARNINFEVTVDSNRISLGSSSRLNLNFYGTKSVPVPDLPDIDGFDLDYVGPSTRMSIINGKVSSSITHTYILIPLKTGTFKIPPTSIEYKGETYTSKPLSIKVVKSAVSPSLPKEQTISEESEEEVQALKDRIFLVMQTEKNKAYEGEIIPVITKLYIGGLAIRDIQYPEISHEGFLMDKFAEPRQSREVINGISYEIIEFETNIFGTREGNLKLGSARLKCNLLIRKQSRSNRAGFPFDDNFFSGFLDTRHTKYPLDLKAKEIPITIMPLPKEKVPANFSGAMGNFGFRLEASPKKVKVGDPITLKMTITGNGNFKSVNPPVLNFGDNFKTYEPEIKQGNQSKIFEQVIIPKKDTIRKIPKVSFSFFDTGSAQYKMIAKGPISIKVSPLPKGEELKVFKSKTSVHRKEILGRNIIYIKDTPGKLRQKDKFLCRNKLFIAIQFIPLLVIISLSIVDKRKKRLETDIRYARHLRAPGKARKNLRQAHRFLDAKETDKFFDAIFKTLQEYLGDKFHLSTAGITSGIIENLKSKNIGAETLDKLRECFDNCDMARYTSSRITKEQMQKTFKLVEQTIDTFERRKG